MTENNPNEGAAAISQIWGGSTDGGAVSMPSRPGRPLLRMQYWKLCDRDDCLTHRDKYSGENPRKGWVVTGPTLQGNPYQHAEYQTIKHMTPLPQYGSAPTGFGPDAELSNPITRYKKILEHPDGLNEFPVSQMRNLGWDKLDIIRELRPDVAGTRYPCEYGCYNKDFLTMSDKATHDKAVHPDVVAPAAAAKGVETAIKAVIEANHGEKTASSFSEEQLQQIGIVVATAVQQLEVEKQTKPKSVAKKED